MAMRDITSAPIFMRLGSRMCGPASVSVGALRRILIRNLVCSNSEISFRLDPQRNFRPLD